MLGSGRQRRMVSLGKVTAPKPVNLPSQKKENNGNDASVLLSKSSALTKSWGVNGSTNEGKSQQNDGNGQDMHGEDGHKMPPRVIPAQPSPAWGGAGLPEERKKTLELASREQFPTLGAAPERHATEYPKGSPSQHGLSSWDEDEREVHAAPYGPSRPARHDEYRDYEYRDQYHGRGGRYGYPEDRYHQYGGRRRGPPQYPDDEYYHDEYEERGPSYPGNGRDYGHNRDYDGYENGERYNNRYGYDRQYHGGYHGPPRRPYPRGEMHDEHYYSNSPPRRHYGSGYRDSDYHHSRHYPGGEEGPRPFEEHDRADEEVVEVPGPVKGPPPPPPPRMPPPPPPPVRTGALTREEDNRSGAEDTAMQDKGESLRIDTSDDVKTGMAKQNGEQQNVEKGGLKKEHDALEKSKVVTVPVQPKSIGDQTTYSAWEKSSKPSNASEPKRSAQVSKVYTPINATPRILKREYHKDGQSEKTEHEKVEFPLQNPLQGHGGGLEFDLGTGPVGKASSNSLIDETELSVPEANDEVTHSLFPPSLQGLSLHPMSFGEESNHVESEGLITESEALKAAFRYPDNHPPGLFTSVSVNRDIQEPPQPLMTFGTEDNAKMPASSLGLLLENFTVGSDKNVVAGPPPLQFGDILLPSTIDGCVDGDGSAPSSGTNAQSQRKEAGRSRGGSARGRGRGRGRGEKRFGKGRGDKGPDAPPPPPPPPPAGKEDAGPKQANARAANSRGRRPQKTSNKIVKSGEKSEHLPSTPPGLNYTAPSNTSNNKGSGAKKGRGNKLPKKKASGKEGSYASSQSAAAATEAKANTAESKSESATAAQSS